MNGNEKEMLRWNDKVLKSRMNGDFIQIDSEQIMRNTEH